jgi:RimJ/RimL family protein N-acetyltransferase
MSADASKPGPLAPIELESAAIVMRPYCDDDASQLFAAAVESTKTVGRWMPWCHADYAMSESIAWVERSRACWQSGEEYSFALFAHTREYIGGAGLNHFNRDHNFANLGYWIRQSRQRAGFAVAAVHCLARFGFETLQLTRIEIVAAVDNIASRRVAEKAGAQFECVARNRLVIHGEPMAAAVYSLIPSSLPGR